MLNNRLKKKSFIKFEDPLSLAISFHLPPPLPSSDFHHFNPFLVSKVSNIIGNETESKLESFEQASASSMPELFFYLGQSLVTRGTHQLDRSRRLTRQTPPMEFEFPFIDVSRGNQYIGKKEKSRRDPLFLSIILDSNAFFNKVFFFFDEKSFIDNFRIIDDFQVIYLFV